MSSNQIKSSLYFKKMVDQEKVINIKVNYIYFAYFKWIEFLFLLLIEIMYVCIMNNFYNNMEFF
jgi:hypothetical protein